MKTSLRHRLGFVSATVLLIASCTVGPDYKRPAVSTPDAYRRAASDTGTHSQTNSFADLGWWDVYNDPQLKAYIAEALTNSWDIKIAAARVLQAEAAARITRSEYFPSIYGGADIYTARTSQKGAIPLPAGANTQREYGDVLLSMSAYEIDLWGRIRRANEAARAQLFATVEAQFTVRQTLVSDVATAYFDLLALDLDLEIGLRTLDARTNSFELTKSREEGGVASMQDVYQAQILVSTAEASIVDAHRRIEQQENLLCILLGRNPGNVKRGTPLSTQAVRPEIPAGLPSELLERRPDVRGAEQQLIAANADIGQARAAFYPQVTLTGFFGFQTVALSDLFSGSTKAWQFGPAVSVPLFTGGRLRANLKQTEARFQESLATYQQTVQRAFREVSDGLIAYRRTREFREKEEEDTQAHRDATELANVRYMGGVASYLEVLYNEQELFTSELNLAQARRDEILSVVQVYRALGGGWQAANPQMQAGNHSNHEPPTK